MKAHFIDGTYELFRAFYGAPESKDRQGREVGATRAWLRSLSSFLRQPDVTHVACAFDHVIESFRNELFDGYKTGEGIEPDLWAQFSLAEQATRALGVVVWPMVEFEADDALATAAHRFSDHSEIEQIVLCSPDKDLTQCVRKERVICWDRARGKQLDQSGVVEKFGVPPESIPDFLALVGDAADGIPGIPRWGAKSSASVLARYLHIENIPEDPASWEVKVRGAEALARSLSAHRKEAKLYRQLATLRTDVPLKEQIDDLRWRGANRNLLNNLCEEIGETALPDRITVWSDE